MLAQFEEHLVLMQFSPSTVVNYLADLRALVRWGIDYVGEGFALSDLTPNTIRAYRAHVLEEKHCAPSTANRKLQALRKFCAFAVQAGLMAHNPAAGVQLVQADGNLATTPLTQEQVQRLLEVSASEQPGLARRDRAILMLLLHTGLRVNELVELRLDDVRFNHPGTYLIVADGRHGETRCVPVEGQLRHALYEYLSVRPKVARETRLFLSREGHPLSVRSVQRIVSANARSAGLEGVSAQSLRRTYASHLLATTGDLALVSQRLGHQSLITTTRYISQSSPDGVKASANLVK